MKYHQEKSNIMNAKSYDALLKHTNKTINKLTMASFPSLLFRVANLFFYQSAS